MVVIKGGTDRKEDPLRQRSSPKQNRGHDVEIEKGTVIGDEKHAIVTTVGQVLEATDLEAASPRTPNHRAHEGRVPRRLSAAEAAIAKIGQREGDSLHRLEVRQLFGRGF